MKIPFVKMHGAKNDFLLTMAGDVPITDLQEIAIAICERYTGVGADGWMIVDDAGTPDYDVSIRLFNADGSEPELSGNGTRCAAGLVAMKQPDKSSFRIRTGAGIKDLRLISRDKRNFLFEMNMGEVSVVEETATVQGRDATIVNAGNPQCVVPVRDFLFDWRKLGAAIENDARFPERTNVSFIQAVDDHTIEARFWERGVGETNSSGTGSTGAATVAVARGLAHSPVTVLTPAGPLILHLAENVYLTGPVEYVAEGFFLYGKIALNE